MVKNQDAVVVKPIQRSDGVVVLTIRVADNELGKLIGQGGRIARSLRLILLASVREHGGSYVLDLDTLPLLVEAH